MGTPRSRPTRLTVVPDKWIRSIRRFVDLIVGPIDLICGPEDLLEDSSMRPYLIRSGSLACKIRHKKSVALLDS
jgi:hypothetical protein